MTIAKVVSKRHVIKFIVNVCGVNSANHEALASRVTSFKQNAAGFISDITGGSPALVSVHFSDRGLIIPTEVVTRGSMAFRKRGKEPYQFPRRSSLIAITVVYTGAENAAALLRLKSELGGVFSDKSLGFVSSVKQVATHYARLEVE